MKFLLLGVSTLLLVLTSCFADVIQSYEEGNIRLADGPNPFQGRLEIYYDGSWGTVCSDEWNGNDAQVVCRQLGFSDGVIFDNVINKYPTPSDSSIFLSNVTCDGSELALVDCIHNDWNDNDCGHNQDVNVFCKVHSYKGCFISQYPNYALTGKQVGLPSPLELESCMEQCENFELMGVEGGDSCFCGPSTNDYTQYGEVDADECTTPCVGDNHQYCGGSNRIAVYERGCVSTGSSSGVILSPNFPGNYGSNQECQIEIDLSMNFKTYVTFHLFDLTGDDALTLSDELGDTVTYSASNPPHFQTTIETGRLIVGFVSTSTSTGGAGYVITYNGVLKCPINIEFANGNLIMENHEFYYEGDTATVLCNDGYDPQQEVILCNSDGEWSPTPICIQVGSGELPDLEEESRGERNFETFLLMGVVLIAVLGLAFCFMFVGIICTSKSAKSNDKMPLRNVDSRTPSENSEPVDQTMFDSRPKQGKVNRQVAIEEQNEADSDSEDNYLRHIY